MFPSWEIESDFKGWVSCLPRFPSDPQSICLFRFLLQRHSIIQMFGITLKTTGRTEIKVYLWTKVKNFGRQLHCLLTLILLEFAG
mgnify:CR=1 FL=1